MTTSRPSATDREREDQQRRHDKLFTFLITEMPRKEHRQCVQVELLYAPGDGLKMETLHAWRREDDSKMFEDLSGIEPLVSAIFQVANDALACKDVGKHRFIVRTHQHLGVKPTHLFCLCTPYKADELRAADRPVDRRIDPQDPRACLLVRVAGSVSVGLLQRPDGLTNTPQAIAEVSVEVAEAILQKAGL